MLCQALVISHWVTYYPSLRQRGTMVTREGSLLDHIQPEAMTQADSVECLQGLSVRQLLAYLVPPQTTITNDI